MATVIIRFDTLNLQYYSRGSNQLNCKMKCIATEQEGLKSECQLWLWLQEAQIVQYTTQPPLSNVSVHPQELGELQPQMVPQTQGPQVGFPWLYAGLLHGLQRWKAQVSLERKDHGQMHCSYCMVMKCLSFHFWSLNLTSGWKMGISSFTGEKHYVISWTAAYCSIFLFIHVFYLLHTLFDARPWILRVNHYFEYLT